MTTWVPHVLRSAVRVVLPVAVLLAGCAPLGDDAGGGSGAVVVVAQEAPSAVPQVSVPADAKGPAVAGLVQAVPPPPVPAAPPRADRAGRSGERGPASAAVAGGTGAGEQARPAAATDSSRAGSIAAAVNAQRAAHGLGGLASSSCALRYAQSWAAHVATTGEWGHQALRPVLSGCSASTAGENIARGSGATGETVSAWMGSPGHRANILDGRYTHSGMASVQAPDGRWVTVQIFLTL